MGNDVAELMEELPSARTIKVHAQMCSELLNLVIEVSKILPEIEAARPRCTSGIETLCLLNNGIVKAKSLLQHCNESSKLYLALTGDAILSRCKKSRTLLAQSLTQIQNMVPVTLAATISGVIMDLRSASFSLDPREEEAGKVLRELLHKYGSTVDCKEGTAQRAFQIASSRLHITSQKSLLIEKRSIRKMLDKFDQNEQNKRKILLFFQHLLKNYGGIMIKDQRDDGVTEKEDSFPFPSSHHISREEELWVHYSSSEATVKSCENSMNSIASLNSSINGLDLPADFSSVSLISTQGSDLSHSTIGNDLGMVHGIDLELFSKFGSLPWDSQCNAVHDFKRLLEHNDEYWSMVPSEEFIQLLLKFLNDACDHHDTEAQMTGCQSLLVFLQKARNTVTYIKGDDYGLLASFLDTKVAKEALSILEFLSFNDHSCCEIKESAALSGILNILESQDPELLEPALKILSNLSSNSDILFLAFPSNFISKLVPHFQEITLARHCVTILKNMCKNPDASVFIAETDGCIPSVAILLENESKKDQEHAVCVLLSLCSQNVGYCKLVMDEGVIPGLVNISVNGNKKAKAMAAELLQILKDEMNTGGDNTEYDGVTESIKQQNDDQIAPNVPKPTGVFRGIFSKPRAFSSKKKK